MEESMKNYIDWVWGYGEGDAKKNMWSNRQKKTVMIGAGTVWGRKRKTLWRNRRKSVMIGSGAA